MFGGRAQAQANLGEGINGQPEPEHLFGAAQPGAQFVQLQVWEVEVAKRVLVQRLSMLASSRHPGDDGGVSIAEDTLSGGWVQPFGQRRQHPCNEMGRGFQPVQGCVYDFRSS